MYTTVDMCLPGRATFIIRDSVSHVRKHIITSDMSSKVEDTYH